MIGLLGGSVDGSGRWVSLLEGRGGGPVGRKGEWWVGWNGGRVECEVEAALLILFVGVFLFVGLLNCLFLTFGVLFSHMCLRGSFVSALSVLSVCLHACLSAFLSVLSIYVRVSVCILFVRRCASGFGLHACRLLPYLLLVHILTQLLIEQPKRQYESWCPRASIFVF